MSESTTEKSDEGQPMPQEDTENQKSAQGGAVGAVNTEQTVYIDSKLQMKQPFKILTDIWGVITSWDFLKEMNRYLNENIFDFLVRNWEEQQIRDFVDRMREQTNEDRNTNANLPPIETTNENNKNEVIKTIVDNLKWRETNNSKTYSFEIKEFNESIWTEGYKNHKLLAHVFDDVVPAFKLWTSEDLGIKIYTFASGPAHKQKLFLKSSVYGDINDYIINGFRSFNRDKYSSKKFHQIFASLGARQPQDILYFTDSPKKAGAAIEAGLRSVVLLRPGNRKYPSEEMKGFQTIKSLKDLQLLIP